MGVRLVRYTRNNNEITSYNDHDELINRDLMNQHPIYAITGLQETLNILEDSVYDTKIQLLDNITSILNDINDINNKILNFDAIKNLEETYSIKMDYDKETSTLKGDVKVFVSKNNTNNALQVLVDGLYVPKTITEDTKTITWNIDKSEETLEEICSNGIRFSHLGEWKNIFYLSDASTMYWDNNLQSLVQPEHVWSFVGVVTQNSYDYYTHTVQLCSTRANHDINGLIIGFVFDEDGKPHTISALCGMYSGSNMLSSWALVYDFSLPDQQILFESGNGPNGIAPSKFIYGSKYWSDFPNGITVQVTKFKNIITATCSEWDSTTLNENTKITIDLNDYSWGYLFQGEVKYGYCNRAQNESFFKNIRFSSDNTASIDKFLATVKISQEQNNGIIIKDDGIYSPKFIISKEDNNALIEKESGYYVENVKISSQESNMIQKLEDGLYVQEHSNTKLVTQITHNFIVGDFIYYHPTNGYQKALAIDNYDSNIIGMVIKVINENNFEYQCSGFYKTDLFNSKNGFTQGMPLYISDLNAGKVIQKQPNVSKTVGYPIEDIGLIISIERGIQYNQDATIGDFKVSANTYNIRSDGFIKVAENIEYKQSLVDSLLKTLNEDFKSSYIIADNNNDTIQFTNCENLYLLNKIPDGLNLFIKAF